MSVDVGNIPHKIEFMLEKYNNGQDPETSDPDEVIRTTVWYDGKGSEISDLSLIEALEAAIAKRDTEDGIDECVS